VQVCLSLPSPRPEPAMTTAVSGHPGTGATFPSANGLWALTHGGPYGTKDPQARTCLNSELASGAPGGLGSVLWPQADPSRRARPRLFIAMPSPRRWLSRRVHKKRAAEEREHDSGPRTRTCIKRIRTMTTNVTDITPRRGSPPPGANPVLRPLSDALLTGFACQVRLRE
jgi:hypothetical protein